MDQLEKASRKIILTLLVSQSFFSAALIIGFTVSSIIVVELAGGNKQWTGVPGTLLLVGAASAAYPMGRLMDRFGRRPGLSLGYLLGISGAAITVWAVMEQSLFLFLLGIFFFGLNRGTNDLGRYAAAEAAPSHRRAGAISLVVWGGTFGSIGGPLFTDWGNSWAIRLGWPAHSGPWLLVGLLLLLTLILINLFLRPDPQAIGRQLAIHEPVPATEQGNGRSYRSILTDSSIQVAIGTLIFAQLAMITVMTITPVHMYGHHQPLALIKWVIMAHTLGMFGLSFITGRLVDRFGQSKTIILGGLLLIAACLLAPLRNDTAWLGLALFLLGLGWNFCFVAGSALLTASLKADEKGRIQGLSDALVYTSSAVGSTGSGLIFAALGFGVMSWLTIVVALMPVLLVTLLLADRKRSLEGVPSG